MFQDVSSPVLKVSLGKVVVPVSPDTVMSPVKLDGISVGSDNFSHSNGHTVKSYTLLFRVGSCVRPGVEPLVNGTVSETETNSQRQ